MITTDYVDGSPCWIDLGAPDVPAAVAFYGAVFGWKFQPYGPDGGDYGFFRSDGRTVGAVGRLTEEGARSAWMLYFRTSDAEATARTVEQAGGAVRTAPGDVESHGRMAQFTDPQGGQFAVWQPRATQGMEAVDEPGTLSWVELYTTDAKAARAFYGTVFGWATQDMPMPGGNEGTYTLITPAGLAPERMHGG